MVSLRNIALFIAITCVVASPAAAQLEPPSTGGLVALAQELRMLGHNKRVLMIGAHPDDEDTELLTLLVRGMGAEAAYLSLNRGEGGQNLIGPELGEALGLIRTEELLAARRLDGARQFFTRAYDFGYSKSIEETWRFWPRDSVLKDVVRIVRQFRPQIIVSIFSGTTRDGHGQHQAAGWAAQEAFRIAADSTKFSGLGDPWQPLKLYRSTRFDSTSTTLRLDGGVLDEVVGQSYRQIAMRGRSMHRSQDMGQLQRIGPSEVRLQLIENRTGTPESGLFSGIDTTVTSACGDSPTAKALEHIEAAKRAWTVHTIRDHLLKAAEARDTSFSRIPLIYRCVSPERLHTALRIAQGILVDVVADDDRVVASQALNITVSVWNTGDSEISYTISWHAPAFGSAFRRSAFSIDSTFVVGPRQVGIWNGKIFSLADAASPTPYYLERPRAGAMYQLGQYSPAGAAADQSIATIAFQFNGPPFLHEQEIAFRRNDQAVGEVRRPVIVVPRVDVKLDPATEVWSTPPSDHHFDVTLAHGAKDSTSGTLTLEVPAGWPAVTGQKFELIREDERETFRFSIRPPANLSPGKYEIRAVATDDKGGRYDQGVFTVDYPHIRPRSWTQASIATVNVASLEMPRLNRVGYIRGASDRVPEALASVGVPIELLDGATLERDDLSGFDAIVIGSRAYETDSSLVENNARVVAYARNGGLVIVQYQQHAFFSGHFAPYPMSVGGQPLVLSSEGSSRPAGPPVSHDRVTDETAPVRIIDPNSPVVTRPNRIGAEDWEGWVQERGLYFARSWDEGYQPVLEMADPGEQPLRGGLLVARYGKGTYVYTGISFFRELPAGVPGAFRLFANLLALGERSVP